MKNSAQLNIPPRVSFDMNAGSPPNPPPGRRWDGNDSSSDPVWSLLSRAPLPEPGAWFTISTLARCRRESSGIASMGNVFSLARMGRWLLGGGLAVCLAMALVVPQVHTEKVIAKDKNVQAAFEIVASIDTDSDTSSSPSSSWQDSSL